MTVRHGLEAVGLMLAYGLFRLLPLDQASGLAGWIARAIGPRLGVSARARRNLAATFPDWDRQQIEDVVAGMWDNFGRCFGELGHLPKIRSIGSDPRVQLHGRALIDSLRDDGRSAILFTAHLANMELNGLVQADCGLPLTVAYRAANNPLIDAWLQRRRMAAYGDIFVPKGPAGARGLVAAIKSGRHLGMLPDQKMNDGIPAPFFGRMAMTAPALARLARKYDLPVVPLRIVREGGARFRLIAGPPLDLPRSDDEAADVAETMRQVNLVIEGWVRDNPAQWLWLHNRWPD